MRAGRMASGAAFAAFTSARWSDTLDAYQAAFDDSWVKKELSVVRNVLPLVEKYGDLAGTILAGMTMWLETLKIKVPFTMKHHPDNESLYRADIMPKPDRSEEHTSELQSLMRTSYAVFCLKKKK